METTKHPLPQVLVIERSKQYIAISFVNYCLFCLVHVLDAFFPTDNDVKGTTFHSYKKKSITQHWKFMEVLTVHSTEKEFGKFYLLRRAGNLITCWKTSQSIGIKPAGPHKIVGALTTRVLHHAYACCLPTHTKINYFVPLYCIVKQNSSNIYFTGL